MAASAADSLLCLCGGPRRTRLRLTECGLSQAGHATGCHVPGQSVVI